MDGCVHFGKVRTMSRAISRVLRSDARDNRDRVLEAARDLFAESGLDVTIRQIARRAGVGPATLYRRFPTKQALIREAFAGELRACRGIVQAAAADPDPWRGFRGIIEHIIVLNAGNSGFTEAFLSTYPGALDFDAHRAEMMRAVTGIARRAQAAGRLRPDFVLNDFLLVLMAGRGLATVPAGDRADAARRFAALAIDGLRAAATNGPLPARTRLASTAVNTSR